MESYITPELAADETGRAQWNRAENRRHGYRNLQFIQRYGIALRAPYTLRLYKDSDPQIEEIPSVRHHTSTAMFDSIVVLKGNRILFEKYAPDNSDDQHHVTTSAIKTIVHMMVGALVREKKIDLSAPINQYLPMLDAGSAYAKATVQQLLDMDVVSAAVDGNFSVSVVEPYGVRFMPDRDKQFSSLRDLLAAIPGSGERSPDRRMHYKTANADLLGWVCEVCSGRSLRELVLEIVEAAGCESIVFWRTDRGGIPTVGGGAHFVARDFARYGLLVARGGKGVQGQQVGCTAFTDRTIRHCREGTINHEEEDAYYHNSASICDGCLDQWGWAGQRLTIDPEKEIVVAYMSTLDNTIGTDFGYIRSTSQMTREIVTYLRGIDHVDEATAWRSLQPY